MDKSTLFRGTDKNYSNIDINGEAKEELLRAEKSLGVSFFDDEPPETEGDDSDITNNGEGIIAFELDPRTTYGAKTIGTLSSFVFIINQIFGPGVLALPIVFQQGIYILFLFAIMYLSDLILVYFL